MSDNSNSSNSEAAKQSAASKTPRLGWLDALRGFTMILVVMNHVALKSFGMQIRWSAALQFFLLFRMPLFFFISGFLAYKASRVWDGHTLRELSVKKMRVQLIPTIVFFLLFLAMIPTTPFVPSLMEALASSMKAGYWFTLVLLYMLLTFYAFSYVESKIFRRHEGTGARGRENTPAPPILILLLFIISLCFFETCYLPRYFSWGDVPLFPLLPLWHHRALLLGSGAAADGLPLVLPCGAGAGGSDVAGSDQVAHAAYGVGIAAPYAGHVLAVVDSLHVLQA